MVVALVVAGVVGAAVVASLTDGDGGEAWRPHDATSTETNSATNGIAGNFRDIIIEFCLRDTNLITPPPHTKRAGAPMVLGSRWAAPLLRVHAISTAPKRRSIIGTRGVRKPQRLVCRVHAAREFAIAMADFV